MTSKKDSMDITTRSLIRKVYGELSANLSPDPKVIIPKSKKPSPNILPMASQLESVKKASKSSQRSRAENVNPSDSSFISISTDDVGSDNSNRESIADVVDVPAVRRKRRKEEVTKKFRVNLPRKQASSHNDNQDLLFSGSDTSTDGLSSIGSFRESSHAVDMPPPAVIRKRNKEQVTKAFTVNLPRKTDILSSSFSNRPNLSFSDIDNEISVSRTNTSVQRNTSFYTPQTFKKNLSNIKYRLKSVGEREFSVSSSRSPQKNTFLNTSKSQVVNISAKKSTSNTAALNNSQLSEKKIASNSKSTPKDISEDLIVSQNKIQKENKLLSTSKSRNETIKTSSRKSQSKLLNTSSSHRLRISFDHEPNTSSLSDKINKNERNASQVKNTMKSSLNASKSNDGNISSDDEVYENAGETLHQEDVCPTPHSVKSQSTSKSQKKIERNDTPSKLLERPISKRRLELSFSGSSSEEFEHMGYGNMSNNKIADRTNKTTSEDSNETSVKKSSSTTKRSKQNVNKMTMPNFLEASSPYETTTKKVSAKAHTSLLHSVTKKSLDRKEMSKSFPTAYSSISQNRKIDKFVTFHQVNKNDFSKRKSITFERDNAGSKTLGNNMNKVKKSPKRKNKTASPSTSVSPRKSIVKEKISVESFSDEETSDDGNDLGPFPETNNRSQTLKRKSKDISAERTSSPIQGSKQRLNKMSMKDFFEVSSIQRHRTPTKEASIRADTSLLQSVQKKRLDQKRMSESFPTEPILSNRKIDKSLKTRQITGNDLVKKKVTVETDDTESEMLESSTNNKNRKSLKSNIYSNTVAVPSTSASARKSIVQNNISAKLPDEDTSDGETDPEPYVEHQKSHNLGRTSKRDETPNVSVFSSTNDPPRKSIVQEQDMYTEPQSGEETSGNEIDPEPYMYYQNDHTVNQTPKSNKTYPKISAVTSRNVPSGSVQEEDIPTDPQSNEETSDDGIDPEPFQQTSHNISQTRKRNKSHATSSSLRKSIVQQNEESEESLSNDDTSNEAQFEQEHDPEPFQQTSHNISQTRKRNKSHATSSSLRKSIVQQNEVSEESLSNDDTSNEAQFEQEHEADVMLNEIQNDLNQDLSDDMSMRNTKSQKGKKVQKRRKKNIVSQFPNKLVKNLCEHYAGMKMTSDALEAMQIGSHRFWGYTVSALKAYANHAGRQHIDRSDVYLAFHRSQLAKDPSAASHLIEQNLPLELRALALPMAQAKTNVFQP